MRVGIPLLCVALLVGPVVAEPSPAPIPVQPDQMATLDAYVDEMQRRWEIEDAACTTDAPFALMYLITTEGVRKHIADGHFDDNPFLVEWTKNFADFYLTARDAYQSGGEASPPWQEAFEWGATGQSTVGDDVLMGMNAHINYDLALSTYAMGLPAEGRKADFDRINDALWYVTVPVNEGLGHNYDPGYNDTSDDFLVNPVVMKVIEAWRENAWRNAVRLTEAQTQVERDLVIAEMEAHSVAIARSLQQPRDDQTEARTAYCQASNAADANDPGGDGGNGGGGGNGKAKGHDKEHPGNGNAHGRDKDDDA